MQQDSRVVYTLDDFCRTFSLSRTTAYAELRAGRLRTFKVGARTMVAADDAQAWLEARRGGSKPAQPARAA